MRSLKDRVWFIMLLLAMIIVTGNMVKRVVESVSIAQFTSESEDPLVSVKKFRRQVQRKLDKELAKKHPNEGNIEVYQNALATIDQALENREKERQENTP
ncbi:hypothetical protein [Entomospira culicis]|uniref:Uncharacterized protein n=1 Tax=Entomospira culicis TaxID=2719989 RepID=A0A968GFQ3_9SPIO|nr:hypothetical protein [Entomospira culicis]NIZ19432.1 hypothetical protein [Entomospira culicis]NIZ69663.1 hypothetical protein [Entomospira culicis]WDI36773.1 hypothetical protein PVA46_05465 [Entomospira culicis]WDI38402.1 hypothetical protein PVA47_05475 [Entomospira culicis]